MSFSLNNFLELLLPYLPSSLFSPGIIKAAQKLSGVLPPVYCCGFECRLDGSKQIDFHQCVTSLDCEPEKVINHIASSDSLSYKSWEGIKNFCVHWTDTSSLLHDSVAGIWLEFDMIDPNMYDINPNIFMRLKPPDDKLLNGNTTSSIIENALILLHQTTPPAQLSDNLCQLLETDINEVYVSHFGAMLSRDLHAIRINIAGVDKINIGTYLNRLGLEEQSERLTDIIEGSKNFFDRIVICFDIGDDISTNVGLECFIDDPSNNERRWSSVFDYLAKKGLCKPDRRDSILTWPGFMHPTTGKPWPDNLIIESMLKPDNHFSCVYRKISHIKISCDVYQHIGLKAYFGAVHHWITTHKNSLPTTGIGHANEG